MLLSTSSARLHFDLGLAPSVSDGKDRKYSEAEAFSDCPGTLDRGQKELAANCLSPLPPAAVAGYGGVQSEWRQPVRPCLSLFFEASFSFLLPIHILHFTSQELLILEALPEGFFFFNYQHFYVPILKFFEFTWTQS